MPQSWPKVFSRIGIFFSINGTRQDAEQSAYPPHFQLVPGWKSKGTALGSHGTVIARVIDRIQMDGLYAPRQALVSAGGSAGDRVPDEPLARRSFEPTRARLRRHLETNHVSPAGSPGFPSAGSEVGD
jgi:hypothetical protein